MSAAEPRWPPMPGSRRAPVENEGDVAPAAASSRSRRGLAERSRRGEKKSTRRQERRGRTKGAAEEKGGRGVSPAGEVARAEGPLGWPTTLMLSLLALIATGASLGLILAVLASSREVRTLAGGGILGIVVGSLTFPLAVTLCALIGAFVTLLIVPSLSAGYALRLRALLPPLACAVAPWLILAATPLAVTLGIIPWVLAALWSGAWILLTPIILRAECRPQG